MEAMVLCINGVAKWSGTLSRCKAVARDFIPCNADQNPRRFVVASAGVPVAWCDWQHGMSRLKWEHAEPCAK